MNIEKIKIHIKNNWCIYLLVSVILVVILAAKNKELVLGAIAGVVVIHYIKEVFLNKSVDSTKK